MPGIVQDAEGELHFAEWNCRAGQNNVIIRTDGTVAPCFPMYASTFDWGNIEQPQVRRSATRQMKQTCQQHCFSTLNHNLAYCYNDARVIKWLWTKQKTDFRVECAVSRTKKESHRARNNTTHEDQIVCC